jgi:hypothetical protein
MDVCFSRSVTLLGLHWSRYSEILYLRSSVFIFIIKYRASIRKDLIGVSLEYQLVEASQFAYPLNISLWRLRILVDWPMYDPWPDPRILMHDHKAR